MADPLRSAPPNALGPRTRSPLEGDGRRPIGVYVHFPFCLVKCPYCDFVAYKRRPELIDHRGYADAVIAELRTRLSQLPRPEDYTLESVFFGGGTPSLWHTAELARVLAAVRRAFPRQSPTVEISVECDPAAFGAAEARALVEAGVTRTSIGVQSFDDGRLAFLGRAHRAPDARRALEGAVRAGVPDIAVDLIYGVAGLSPGDASDEARRAVELGATHLSAYSLTIEPRTVFGRLAEKNRLPLADDALVADSFFAVDEELARLGFDHYEISNYARPGRASRHNVNYWKGGEYLGLGTGAVGMLGPGSDVLRYRNEPNPKRYQGLALANAEPPSSPSEPNAPPQPIGTSPHPIGDPTLEYEQLAPETRLRERIMLGLRLREGVDLAHASRACGADAFTPDRERQIARLTARGRLIREGDRVSIPRDAWIWADDTAASLF